MAEEKDDFQKQAGNFLTGPVDQLGRAFRLLMTTVDWIGDKPIQRVPAALAVVSVGLFGANRFFAWKGESAAPVVSIQAAAPKIQNPNQYWIERFAELDQFSVLVDGGTIAGPESTWEEIDSCTPNACPVTNLEGEQIGLISGLGVSEAKAEKYRIAIVTLIGDIPVDNSPP